MTTENRKVIYESPDGGKTVYARLEGTQDSILHVEESDYNHWNRIKRFSKWKEILIEAETNKSLDDLIEPAEAFYELIRNRK